MKITHTISCTCGWSVGPIPGFADETQALVCLECGARSPARRKDMGAYTTDAEKETP